DFPWRPLPVQGEPAIQVFTSLKWMHDAIGPSRFVMSNFLDIVSAWPDVGWTLILNPATPIDAAVPGERVRGLVAAPGSTPAPETGSYPDAVLPAAAPHPETARQPDPAPAPVPYPDVRGMPAPSAAITADAAETEPTALPEFLPGNDADQEL